MMELLEGSIKEHTAKLGDKNPSARQDSNPWPPDNKVGVLPLSRNLLTIIFDEFSKFARFVKNQTRWKKFPAAFFAAIFLPEINFRVSEICLENYFLKQ